MGWFENLFMVILRSKMNINNYNFKSEGYKRNSQRMTEITYRAVSGIFLRGDLKTGTFSSWREQDVVICIADICPVKWSNTIIVCHESGVFRMKSMPCG